MVVWAHKMHYHEGCAKTHEGGEILRGVLEKRTRYQYLGHSGVRVESSEGVATSRRYRGHEALLLMLDVQSSRFPEYLLRPHLTSYAKRNLMPQLGEAHY